MKTMASTSQPVDAPDTVASTTSDHPFESRDAWWWSLCKHCNLAESRHLETKAQHERP
jgi:hypothetical protein